MIYLPLPLNRIETLRTLPVDVWDAKGNLLLRKGQCIQSEQHRVVLEAHQACALEADYKAWVRAYDRLIYAMLRDGVSIAQIANATMPAVILEVDYTVGHDIAGGWLDIQVVLNSVLHPGEVAKNPLEKLDGIQRRVSQLLELDADESLFCLFQALADRPLGYCATHALLCAAVCELTARKLGIDEIVRPVLLRAALTMNIGMAKEQDLLARQRTPPDPQQRQLIQEHALRSADILRSFGIVNEDLLDIVQWHHAPDTAQALARNLACRRLLHLVDVQVAKMSARSTRAGLSALGAAKASIMGAEGEDALVNRAMSTVLGFYPPGTYVCLSNGEKAVCVKRGAAANTPLVVSIMNPQGMPLSIYVARDTRDKASAIVSPLSPESIKLKVLLERVQKAMSKVTATS